MEMSEATWTPVPATRHVAVQQDKQPHGWWAMFQAWVKGAGRW